MIKFTLHWFLDHCILLYVMELISYKESKQGNAGKSDRIKKAIKASDGDEKETKQW